MTRCEWNRAANLRWKRCNSVNIGEREVIATSGTSSEKCKTDEVHTINNQARKTLCFYVARVAQLWLKNSIAFKLRCFTFIFHFPVQSSAARGSENTERTAAHREATIDFKTSAVCFWCWGEKYLILLKHFNHFKLSNSLSLRSQSMPFTAQSLASSIKSSINLDIPMNLAESDWSATCIRIRRSTVRTAILFQQSWAGVLKQSSSKKRQLIKFYSPYPHSDSSELQRPAESNPAVLRFYRYVQAARDGQEQRDCINVYQQCNRPTKK